MIDSGGASLSAKVSDASIPDSSFGSIPMKLIRYELEHPVKNSISLPGHPIPYLGVNSHILSRRSGAWIEMAWCRSRMHLSF